MKRVVIHIDRLTLNGFRREDRHAVAAGLQQRLAQMFGGPDAVASLGSGHELPRLQAGSVRIEPGASPQRAGSSVAERIGRSLRR